MPTTGGAISDAATPAAGPPPALAAFAAASPASNATIDAIRAALPAPAGLGGRRHRAVLLGSEVERRALRRAVRRGCWARRRSCLARARTPSTPAPTRVQRASALIAARAAELAAQGSRVLLLSRTEAPLAGDHLPDGLVPVGLVVLGEHVRADAPETLRYFTEQGVEAEGHLGRQCRDGRDGRRRGGCSRRIPGCRRAHVARRRRAASRRWNRPPSSAGSPPTRNARW